MTRAGALLLAAISLNAADFPRYDILRTPSAIKVDGRLDERAWRRAKPAGDFHFNWWTAGAKEQTVAKLLWDDDRLYVSYYCHDKHISATVTERHGPVSKDDCVEIFLSPNPSKPRNYYGFEMNVIGTMLNFRIADWWTGKPQWEPEGVELRTSYFGLPKKDESPRDDHWTLEVSIPFRNFARDAAHVPPRDGDEWRIGLNRAGGVTDAQYSTWAPVATPTPNFHVPESFGYVRFVNRKP
ncbi:MAG: carbohydrate-binding family 9-like protein [Bryobacteraceae bacterium]